jgi:hypothetical protein
VYLIGEKMNKIGLDLVCGNTLGFLGGDELKD